MVRTGDDSSADAYVLLADEFKLVLGLVRHSESLAEQLLRMFLAEGKVDRHDDQDRYRMLLLHVKPGGGLSSDDREFWWSDTERRVCCDLKPWDSSAVWTGPVLEERQDSLGRQTAEIRVWGIRIHHAKFVEFLQGKGFQLRKADVMHQAGVPLQPAAPSEQPETQSEIDPFSTGGRPSAAHLVHAEACRRIENGEVTVRQGDLTAFAKVLETWWKEERKRYDPLGPPLTHGHIANVVRSMWNEALAKS
jgi:hypothetical protein